MNEPVTAGNGDAGQTLAPVRLLDGVREYCEEMDVEIRATTGMYRIGLPDESCPGYGRLVVKALNEGGYNSTEVDLLELLAWVKKNMPDVWSAV
jgi:hypothetical protein